MPINKTELSEELELKIKALVGLAFSMGDPKGHSTDYKERLADLTREVTKPLFSLINKAISEAKKAERERILPILRSVRANSPISGIFANNRKVLDELIDELSQSKKETKPWHFCEECGDKEYPNADKSQWTGITVMTGKCPICGKEATLIPRADFEGKGD